MPSIPDGGCACAESLRAREKARAQCRARFQRLGHTRHTARVEEAGRGGRLEHLWYRLDRRETLDPSADLPLAANAAPLVRLAERRETRAPLRTEWLKTATARPRQEIASRFKRAPSNPALCADGAMVAGDRLPPRTSRASSSPRIVHVERREDLKPSAATLARIAPRLLISSH